MKNNILILVCCMLLSTAIHSQNETIVLPEISKEINAMRGQDQEYRIKYMKLVKKGKTESKKFKKLLKDLKEIDRSNTARMKEIVMQYGWPTYNLVGQRASNSAWLIVQHSDRNPLFQKYCLPLLKEAVLNKQATPSNYAYLYDRVQLAKGEKQLYATQSSTNNGIRKGSFQTIEDEANVQVRREEMGIEQHIESYAQSLGFNYKIPTKEEAMEKALGFVSSYQLNVQKAKDAMNNEDYLTAVKYYSLALESYGSINTEDYVQMARAISLSKHEKSSSAFSYLMKAAIRGWEDINDFDTDKDFNYLKISSPDNWEDLMNIVSSINADKK